jgi:hypothetical protein
MTQYRGWDATPAVATHLLVHEGDKVVTVLGLLKTGEGHLGAGDVLLGVLKVLRGVRNGNVGSLTAERASKRASEGVPYASRMRRM